MECGVKGESRHHESAIQASMNASVGQRRDEEQQATLDCKHGWADKNRSIM